MFIAHGSPMLAVETNTYASFLEELGRTMKRPKAVVLFTAHWESDPVAVSSSDEPYGTIHDFGGFPGELYEIRYPARGSSELAEETVSRLERKGIAARKDESRGLDHGSWVPLRRMFPSADIPVVQVSVNPFRPVREQFAIGEALRGLGGDDVLVIGSGSTVHNLRMLRPGAPAPEPWAVAFDDWLIGRMQERDGEALCRYEELAPHAKTAVPRAEHLVPLFIAMGSAGPEAKGHVLHRSYEMGSLSYLCVRFD